jgi:DNA polymerase delta subunit 1
VIIYEDFASLYPNIMRSFNLCYSAYVYPGDVAAAQAAHDAGKIVLRRFDVGDGRAHHFVQALEGPQLGIIPELLNNVLAARSRAKRAMADAPDAFTRRVQNARQLSLKITANSE